MCTFEDWREDHEKEIETTDEASTEELNEAYTEYSFIELLNKEKDE